MPSLRAWETASALFFAYVVVAAVAGPGRAAPMRRRALAIASGGLALTAMSAVLPATALLHDWLIPPALLLAGYWSSGCLFVRPMPGAERWLLAVDDALGIGRIAAGMPRALVELLEAAYASIYPMIPIALAVVLVWGRTPGAERFWTVILITDYVCFAALPWLQTRPPRSLESAEPWVSRIRALNRGVVDAASIRVNTCPSGHAAEALAAALLVLAAPSAIVGLMLAAALAVSAGAVFGRYHYAVDALAGWAVALGVWLAFG